MTDDRRLLAFGLGTFHAVLLTLLLVLPLYLTTDLGDALAKLNTAVGLAIFGALWATSVYCTHRGMRDAGLQPGEEAPAENVLHNGLTWGAWNGMLFFWCLLTGAFVVLVADVAAESADRVAGVVVFGLIAAGAGTIASAIVGAATGVLFTVLHIEMLWAARSIAGAGLQQ